MCVGRVAGRVHAPKVMSTALPIAETGRPGTITVLTVLERAASWEMVNGHAAEPPPRALRRLAVDESQALLVRACVRRTFSGCCLTRR